MSTNLRERLDLLSEWCDPSGYLRSAQDCAQWASVDDEQRAWHKSGLAHSRHLAALAAYFAGNPELARRSGQQCLNDSMDYLFGNWRASFKIPENHRRELLELESRRAKRTGGPLPLDARQASSEELLRRYWDWTKVFKGIMLWGSVLGDWEALNRAGAYPQADSHIDSEHAQDMDTYVALGGFLRNAPSAELEPLFLRAASSKSRFSGLILAMMRACLARDAGELQRAFVAFLRHYKRSEFPKKQITRKITIEGTFFFHWASHNGLNIEVPPEFVDHIVPSDLIPPAPQEVSTPPEPQQQQRGAPDMAPSRSGPLTIEQLITLLQARLSVASPSGILAKLGAFLWKSPEGQQGHLYGVLGTERKLAKFGEQLSRAKLGGGPLSVNRGLIEAMPDGVLEGTSDEAALSALLSAPYERFIHSQVAGKGLVVLADLELLFAHNLDPGLLCSLTQETDHIVLLLPGKREQGKVLLFPQSKQGGFELPPGLIAGDDLWEIK